MIHEVIKDFNRVERLLREKGIDDLSSFETLMFICECKKIETLSYSLLGGFSPDDLADFEDIQATPISKIARALFHESETDDTHTTVVKELFDLNHNIVTK